MPERNPSLTATAASSAPATFTLPPLPYGYQDLQPHLGEETLHVHHDRHHAKYVENLNHLLSGQSLAPTSLEDVIRSAARTGNAALFNNAAQAWNHSFFWESMTPRSAGPEGRLAEAIVKTFGSPEKLRERFIAAGLGQFGSGWVWIVARNGVLEVLSTHDAQTPISDTTTIPLLTCDVWEHAYYIEHRQDRAAWLTDWWSKLANWRFAEKQFAAATGQGSLWSFPAATH
ncbi:MAG: superoxide dismutase [Novosphingobium sp.]|nr:superoxide dismutase [Novosphingobium sp.]